MISSLISWIGQHTLLLSLVAALSVILLLISILATPWLIAQLPRDYLLQPDPRSSRSPLLQAAVTTLRTLVGITLILLGLFMLVLPGPGLVSLVLGISLASFPGKRRLLRYVASRRSVFSTLNWMRRYYGRPPLLHPYHSD